ncbi:fluoride efflux transporter CrcB [Lentibacillus sp. N15]|uniref:fluoride efflux transporter CrcB n=1 Tax=Lentibacillus songyuanensis TaxID=3136161 RepID=UPI0031BB3DA9
MLINVIMVAIGAAFGVLARVLSSNWIKSKWTHTFPLATFIVNITGSLLLGFLTGLAIGSYLSLLLGTGFMGSFTTFSTFNVENIELLRKKKYKHFISYIGASYVIGIVAVFVGIAIGNVVRTGV